MRICKLCAVLVFVMISFELLGQKRVENQEVDYLLQPNRIEFEYKFEDGDYHIVPADEMGLVVLKETSERSSGGYYWEYHYVDTLLQEKWVKKYVLSSIFEYRGFDYSAGYVNLLYAESRKRDVREFTLLRLNLANGDTTQFKLETIFPLSLTEFEVLGDIVIIGGYANYRPVIFLYDLEERRMKVLPGFYNNKSELLDIELDDERLRFNTLMAEFTPGNRQTISIRTFNQLGEMLQNRVLEPEDEKSLLYGQSTRLNRGAQYITGTYAARKSNYSRGVYIAKINRGQQEYLKYYAFPDLENFFSFLPSKRQERVENRLKRRRVSGKKIRLSYRLLVHDIVKLNDNYVMIGEAYYLKQASPYSSLSIGQFSNQAYDQYIVGYKYTHAVIIAFDENGEVTWDNSFEISDVLSTELKQFVHVAGKKDEVILLYMFEGEIRSKLIIGDDISEGKTISAIKLMTDDDELIKDREEEGGLAKWNGNSFYAYGIQRIKQKNDSRRRHVFYINKIVYQ
ncbi:MAG: hypothetical protein O2887_15315 [Bacteroidetes bacterium]|nr:hypothetical protein [Bacteroidota bacterium]MDA1121832.1 hypothetical protein [Bacteroidota bacterium]